MFNKKTELDEVYALLKASKYADIVDGNQTPLQTIRKILERENQEDAFVPFTKASAEIDWEKMKVVAIERLGPDAKNERTLIGHLKTVGGDEGSMNTLCV